MIQIAEETRHTYQTRINDRIDQFSGTGMTHSIAAENAAITVTGRSEIEETYLCERVGDWRIYNVRFDEETSLRVAVCQIS